MKAVLRVITVIFFIFLIYSITDAREEQPVDYMKALSEPSKNLVEETWAYMNLSAHSRDLKAIEESRKNRVKSIADYIEKVKKLMPYKGDDSFRGSVLKYLTVLHSVVNLDYGKIVDMKQVAEESYDNFEALILAEKRANEKLDESLKLLQDAEKAFAAKYNIILTASDSDLIKKIRKASDAMDYSNNIHLILFKSLKQEAYLIAALMVGDIGKIEQNRKTLIKFSNEGLKKLSSEKKYDNDDSLITACRKALDFYKTEAEEKTPPAIDYLMNKESFEKMQKSFEAMDSSEKTQEVVDQYNAKVNEMNRSASKVNEINEDLNEERADIIEKWNNAVSEFIDKYVPK